MTQVCWDLQLVAKAGVLSDAVLRLHRLGMHTAVRGAPGFSAIRVPTAGRHRPSAPSSSKQPTGAVTACSTMQPVVQLDADPKGSGCFHCCMALLCESCQSEAADRSMLAATCQKLQIRKCALACCSMTGNNRRKACGGLKRIPALEAYWDATQSACER